MNYDAKLQFIIVGDTTVGKTSIIKYYFEQEKVTGGYLATVGVDFYTKDIQLGKKVVRTKVWDTAGQERFHSLTNSFFKNAQGVILVYDINNKESFRSLTQWLKSIKENIDEKKATIIIIGNKDDLPHKVDIQEAEEFCKSKNSQHFVTSAKTGKGIEEAFKALITKTAEKTLDTRPSDLYGSSGRFSIDINNKNKYMDDTEEGGSGSKCKC